jgi:monothiol glutaredoxin
VELSPVLKQKIEGLIAKDNVVLFMKGTRGAPRCGFSAAVVEILDELVPSYETIDVLADAELRDGIKAFSSWPTIPQLFIKGELVGGADITKEMYGTGELHKLLGVTKESAPAEVKVTLTPAAAGALRDALAGAGPDAVLRLSVSPRFRHQLGFGPKLEGDRVCESEGIAIHVDGPSVRRAHGVKIDAARGPDGGLGFRIENPHEPPRVKQIGVRELKQKLDDARARGTALALFDVRTPGEAATARIEGARLLDDGVRAEIEALPKSTPLVFHCHHGGRSNAAAEHYLAQGFTDVSNVAGGIDAWSAEVDPSVPRY